MRKPTKSVMPWPDAGVIVNELLTLGELQSLSLFTELMAMRSMHLRSRDDMRAVLVWLRRITKRTLVAFLRRTITRTLTVSG